MQSIVRVNRGAKQLGWVLEVKS